MIPRERRVYRARRTRTIWVKDIGKSINAWTYNKWVINNVWTGSLRWKRNTFKHSYKAQLAKQAKRSGRLMRVITTVQICRFGPFPRRGLPPSSPSKLFSSFLPPSRHSTSTCFIPSQRKRRVESFIMWPCRVRHIAGFTVIIFNS
jgi:hypothetical protein